MGLDILVHELVEFERKDLKKTWTEDELKDKFPWAAIYVLDWIYTPPKLPKKCVVRCKIETIDDKKLLESSSTLGDPKVWSEGWERIGEGTAPLNGPSVEGCAWYVHYALPKTENRPYRSISIPADRASEKGFTNVKVHDVFLCGEAELGEMRGGANEAFFKERSADEGPWVWQAKELDRYAKEYISDEARPEFMEKIVKPFKDGEGMKIVHFWY